MNWGRGLLAQGQPGLQNKIVSRKEKEGKKGKGKKGNEEKGEEREEWWEGLGGKGDTTIHKAGILSNPMCYSFIPSSNKYSRSGCLHPQSSRSPVNTTAKIRK